MIALCAAASMAASEARADDANVDPYALSPEQLFDATVISASRTPLNVWEAPAAIYVITGADIERSGATSIPEALRLAPAVQVARINASGWAISVRGFNSALANKLLILIDGREVYDPLFSGVYWDVQDTALEDIDRIENHPRPRRKPLRRKRRQRRYQHYHQDGRRNPRRDAERGRGRSG